MAQTAAFGRGDENVFTSMRNRYIAGVNETSNIPRAGTSTSLFNPTSDYLVEDGSYLRLKSLTLAYDLPLQQLGWDKFFSKFNVYVTGTNLWLITDYSMGDPEVSNYGSGIEQGVAKGVYPYATTFTGGVKLSF